MYNTTLEACYAKSKAEPCNEEVSQLESVTEAAKEVEKSDNLWIFSRAVNS